MKINTFVLEKSTRKYQILWLKLGVVYSIEYIWDTCYGQTSSPDSPHFVISRNRALEISLLDHSDQHAAWWGCTRAWLFSRCAYPSWGPSRAPCYGFQPFMAQLPTASPYNASEHCSSGSYKVVMRLGMKFWLNSWESCTERLLQKDRCVGLNLEI